MLWYSEKGYKLVVSCQIVGISILLVSFDRGQNERKPKDSIIILKG